MRTLWKYLSPLRWWILLALSLAALAQVLELVDPLILGRIIDDYVLNPNNLTESERVQGAIVWLLVAVGIAFIARLGKTLQDYFLTYVVQSSGMQLFNDGLRQMLRLSYQEYEQTSSRETVATLQKVRMDVERFINSTVNVLFCTIISMGFLLWYSVTRHWALIPIFFGRRVGHGRADRFAEPPHPNDPESDCHGNAQHVWHDDQVTAQRRTGQEPRPDIPGDSAEARLHAVHI